jgi:glycosyltransferase involved in cell wall biosynthesis
VLIEALDELHRRGTEFRCTLVGDGPSRPTIESEIARRGLSQQVHLTGSLDPDQVDRQYETAGAVVLASFSEGVPVVLMEAMARGIPVVATHVGGVGELVETGVNGLLVHAGDAKALAAALHRILSDPEFARAMGARGVQKVRDEFDLERSAERLLELFEQSTRTRRVGASTSSSTLCLPATKTADS